MNNYTIITLMIIFYNIINYFIKNNKDDDIDEIEIPNSSNILNTDHYLQIILILKCEEHRLKYYNDVKTSLLFKNFINIDSCNYLGDSIKKYNHKQRIYEYKTKSKRMNKQPEVLDIFLIKNLMNKHKNNKTIFDDLVKLYNKYNEITQKVIKITEQKFKTKKLYLLSSNIIRAFEGFYIPWHADLYVDFRFHDNLQNQNYVIQPPFDAERGPNQYKNNKGEVYGYSMTQCDYHINYKNNMVKNAPYLTVIPTTNSKDISINLKPSNITAEKDKYAGGASDKDAKIAVLLYLNSGDGIDFTGGELLIGANKKITPKKGHLAICTGGPESYHMVNEVKSGERISFLFWLTDNKDVTFKRNRIFNNEVPYT
jgi:hypothetical protein